MQLLPKHPTATSIPCPRCGVGIGRMCKSQYTGFFCIHDERTAAFQPAYEKWRQSPEGQKYFRILRANRKELREMESNTDRPPDKFTLEVEATKSQWWPVARRVADKVRRKL